MSTKNMELMKQLIEAKKNKNTPIKGDKLRPTMQSGGSTHKAFNNKKTGGAFDK